MTSATVVGSGPNGLAAALTLAAEGVEVTVLEGAEELGGGTRSSELTVPGLIHDECSAAHPLALDTPFANRFDLGAHGLEWCEPAVEYSHPLDGGRGSAAVRSVDLTAASLGLDATRWRRLFGAVSERFAEITADFLHPMIHVPDHPVLLARFGLRSLPPAAAVARAFRTEEGAALWAGVAAHAFRPFSAPMSSAVGVTLGAAGHASGWPVARGGSGSIAHAMVALLREHGARLETGVTVRSLAELERADAVLLDLAPAAAADVAGDRIPALVARALRRYKHGPGSFKVDFAVEGGVPWAHAESREAGTVHVGGTATEIAHAEAQVARGRMPERPFVLCCQQYVADPSRSKGELHPFYAYAHVPPGYDGDATEQVERQIERFAPGFRERVVARHVRGPREMEAYNPNYVCGDVITGANTPLQMVFRPRIALDPYRLADGVYICSAATPPGAGAHGMCGWNAARSVLGRL